MSIEIVYFDHPMWQPFSAIELLRNEAMAEGSRVMLDNWRLKYISARIDMRTGAVLLMEGDCRYRAPRYFVVRQKSDGG